ncbi:CdaR family protein [Sediminibacillus albus]|uniref:YbbR domain-containing protein n=1 Tax=Sediminibacillus albus TaxID=407036 RepID=A0A1G9AHB9_9BACI|nr:CdaR family protein [Sediminibacillus albus]SDK26671.1 YbbR domain-containing protein [Sediminibacillus albus]
MDNWLKSPWVIRALALIMAILLFTAVRLDENITPPDNNPTFIPSGSNQIETMNNVPVNIRIDEENYVVSGVPETINMNMEGPNSSITPLVRKRSFEVFVDLEGLDPGTHNVNIQYSGIPDDVDVDIEPVSAEVTIEERASETFNVTVDYINPSQIADGFEIGKAKADPGTVEITSSQSEVDKVAVVKAYVDLKEVDKPIDSREVPVKVYDSQGNELSVRVEPETVEVSVDVNSPSKQVPIEAVTTGELQDGISIKSIEIEPENATVFASEENLAAIEQLKTEEIDLSKITEASTMEVSLASTPEIRLLDPEQVKVTIELERTETSTFSDIPIDVDNLPDDLSLRFLTPEENSMDIEVLGTEEELSDLGAGDFQLSVNAGGLEEGEHELPVEVSGPEGIAVEPEFEEVTVQIE